ncbi:DUF1127 domain-containing protein [Neptunicoccus sediminis]|uniref:DUF1127 domain-containing protein n=1 Tax=Neptunicoccus sediminis TaxID=1892596 RepID=UPI0008462470|nr:DUF1127 domain-containing protein [Neptunicoccus sediminis]
MALIETHPSRKLRAALNRSTDSLQLLDTLPLLGRLRTAIDRSRNLNRLRQMPDHLLRDIGLDDGDIEQLKPTPFISDMDDSDSLRLR